MTLVLADRSFIQVPVDNSSIFTDPLLQGTLRNKLIYLRHSLLLILLCVGDS